MKRIGSYLADNYRNLKLNVKLFLTITMIMLTTLIVVLGGLQYVFSLYDKQFYAKSSQVLMMSSNSIEEELERLKEVSYNVAVDPQIQNILAELQGEVSRYDFYRLEQLLEDELVKYVTSEKYIQSIYLYDSAGREFVAGDSSNPLKTEDKEAALREADQFKGENYWMELDGNKGELLSVRLIRSYEQLNFESIGKLIVRVNLDGIVKDLPKPQGDIAGKIVITKGDKVFYSEKEMGDLGQYDFARNHEQGYRTEHINGEKTFVNYITTGFKDWTYWSIIPFNVLFSTITVAKYTVILVFLLMFVLLITLGFNFLRKITNPIQELASTMQEVQQGNFQVVNSLNPSMVNESEVGILYGNFITMIHRIDELIQENLSKQLLIKETEFRALQAQINPHFLYNTLESVNWLAKINNQEQISNMVEALGDLMRYSTNFKQDIITLEEELDIVHSYLTIQKYRFDDRVEFQIDVPAHVGKYKIPKLILQPLLENSFKHAVEASIEVSVIKVKVYQEGNNLYARIEDNGPGIDSDILQNIREGRTNPKGTGIGLKNIDDRIKLYAGEEYGLNIENLSGKGTAITVVLPGSRG